MTARVNPFGTKIGISIDFLGISLGTALAVAVLEDLEDNLAAIIRPEDMLADSLLSQFCR
jgi:hypothetical protein